MTDKKDPNKKHYFKPISFSDFAEVMQMHCARENSAPLIIWEKGENEDQAELYIAVSYLPEKKMIIMNPTGSLITKITGSTKAKKAVLLRVCVEDKINFFTGGHLLFRPEDLTYSLEITQEVFKSQQRENFRLNASAVIPIQFKIDNQVFDALDISTGGTSFMISENEKSRFEKGSLFQDCTIRFDRKNYYIPIVQVAILLPLKDENGMPTNKIKVGISFKDIARKTAEELYIKITTEARGDEMKKKFDTILSKKPEST